MSANSLKQAVTSATSSVITLASAVTGFNAFTAADDGIEQTYWVFEGNDFQICVGVYTHSGATLAIDTILQKSVSGVVSDLPATGLTLTSAAQVIVAGNGINQSLTIQTSVIGTRFFKPHNLPYQSDGGKGGGIFNSAAGRLVLSTCIFVHPVVITEIGTSINIASAGGNIRMGIYQMNADGSAGDLIVGTGDLATDSTGEVFETLSSPILLPAGRYLLADMADNETVTANATRTQGQVNPSGWGFGQGAEGQGDEGEEKNYYDLTYGALPATLGTADGSNGWESLGVLFK